MVIGLTGKALSGKDTALGFIREGFPDHEIIHKSFARKMKISCARALGFEGTDDECIDFADDLKWAGKIKVEWNNTVLKESPSLTSNWENWEISGREFEQNYGTEAHRDIFGQDFWVHHALADVTEPNENGKVIVITDVRFPNEAVKIKELGGYLVYIDKPSADVGDKHTSESGIENPDFTIVNDSTLDKYRYEVIQTCKQIIPAKRILDID